MHIPAQRTDPSNKNPLVLKIIFIKLAPVSIGSIDWKFSIINELFRCYCISTIEFYKMFNFTNYPMLWNIPDPVDAGGAEGSIRVEATGDDARFLRRLLLGGEDGEGQRGGTAVGGSVGYHPGAV